jgi:hypothetical protein
MAGTFDVELLMSLDNIAPAQSFRAMRLAARDTDMTGF